MKQYATRLLFLTAALIFSCVAMQYSAQRAQAQLYTTHDTSDDANDDDQGLIFNYRSTPNNENKPKAANKPKPSAQVPAAAQATCSRSEMELAKAHLKQVNEINASIKRYGSMGYENIMSLTQAQPNGPNWSQAVKSLETSMNMSDADLQREANRAQRISEEMDSDEFKAGEAAMEKCNLNPVESSGMMPDWLQ